MGDSKSCKWTTICTEYKQRKAVDHTCLNYDGVNNCCNIADELQFKIKVGSKEDGR